jgi:glyoxylase-like metal-dependent hydrolase (beta-lactamase superfamily II)
MITQHTIATPYMVGPVHCYSCEINNELVLFDTGPPTDIAKKYLKENIDFGRLKYVFITHCHIDHYGLAYWLEEKSDTQIFLPYRDHLKMLHHSERISRILEFLKEMGFDKEFVEACRKALPERNIFPPYPHSFKVVEDYFPTHLGVDYLNCPGHSQSDLIFYHDSWAVTGDVLLRGVFQSPLLDVDLNTSERFRNYDAYCATLGKLATLRGKEVFPGHRKRISGVDETILFYVEKLLDRIGYIQPLTTTESIAQVLERVFGKQMKTPFHAYLKVSELIFMLDFLEDPLRLQQAMEGIGLFSRIEEKYHKITAG